MIVLKLSVDSQRNYTPDYNYDSGILAFPIATHTD